MRSCVLLSALIVVSVSLHAQMTRISLAEMDASNNTPALQRVIDAAGDSLILLWKEA
jgi:hypothetical protein